MQRNAKAMCAIGCALIVASLGVLLFSQFRGKIARESVQEILQAMETVLPEGREGFADPYRNPEMPALEIDGEDFIALLEIPSFGVKLPVGGNWDKGKVISYPCRFWGSVYDGSLIVGGYDQSGQFDCFDLVQDGSLVTLTDMTGEKFSFSVERVERSKSARAEILMDGAADLTLFVRDAYLLEYIILRCVVK